MRIKIPFNNWQASKVKKTNKQNQRKDLNK